MNDRQLRYILTIASEKNITMAANKLNISQPSLSALLAHVEEEIGTKLFDREVSPIALTYAGEFYISAAKKILGVKNELQSQIDDIIDSRKGRLILGCTSRLSPILLPAILPNFINDNPGVQIKLFEESVPILEDLLISGNLEVAFTTASINNNTLGRVPLYDEKLVLLAPKTFAPLLSDRKQESASLPTIEPSMIDGQSFVLFKQRHQLRKKVDQIFNDNNIKPHIILETENWETCYFMVKESMAFTILPYSLLVKDKIADDVILYDFRKKYYRHLSVYYRKNVYQLKIIEKFISSVQNSLQALQGL